jgi:hypothetical protein
MLGRSISAVVVIILLMVGGGAALVVWQSQDRAEALAADEREVLASLDRVGATLRALGAAQDAYVVPGQNDRAWFERVSAAIQQLYDELAALGSTTTSAGAPSRLQSLTAGVDGLLATDVQVRELLRIDQELMAADVILGDGRAAVDLMITDVLALAAAERNAFAAARRGIDRSVLEAVGATAGAWLVGMLLLAWRPAQSISVPASVVTPAATPAATGDMTGPSTAALDLELNAADAEGCVHEGVVDLDTVTDVAAAIARVTSGSQVQSLLERAMTALGARGLMLWLGAGEELFPAMAAGYPRRVVRQLRPLPQSDGNAAVSAWTSGRVRTVAGTATSSGAIVAPLFGTDRAIGVLAAEMPDGREQRAEVRAAVALIAAQLAGIVPAWPAGSGSATTGGTTAPADPRAAEPYSEIDVDSDPAADIPLNPAANG